jgi:hypothetical protein
MRRLLGLLVGLCLCLPFVAALPASATGVF